MKIPQLSTSTYQRVCFISLFVLSIINLYAHFFNPTESIIKITILFIDILLFFILVWSSNKYNKQKGLQTTGSLFTKIGWQGVVLFLILAFATIGSILYFNNVMETWQHTQTN